MLHRPRDMHDSASSALTHRGAQAPLSATVQKPLYASQDPNSLPQYQSRQPGPRTTATICPTLALLCYHTQARRSHNGYQANGMPGEASSHSSRPTRREHLGHNTSRSM